jgi:predicted nuclease of restriction endonuclease-like RecB superfamily
MKYHDLKRQICHMWSYLGIVEGALPTLPGRVEEVSSLLYLGREEKKWVELPTLPTPDWSIRSYNLIRL